MTDRTDSFTRANSTTTLGTPSDGGSAWVAGSGTWGVVSNQGYKEATAATNENAWLEASVANVEVQATLVSSQGGGGGGLLCRVADDSNNILAQVGVAGTNLSCYKKVTGSYTQIGSTFSGIISNGDVLKLRCDSSNLITAYQNGVSRVSVTDAAGSANTKHGLECFGAGTSASNLYDDFSITAIGGGGTTVALTGVSGTGAVGTLAPSASLALTQNAGVGAVGTLAPAVTLALTGVTATGDVGTLTPVSGVVIALTGVSASGDIGLLAPSVSAVLTGVQAIGAVGSLSIPGSNVYGRSGLGGDDVPRRKNPNRGWDREEWLARKQKMDDMEQTLRETYQSIKRTALPSVIKEVEKVVSKNVVKIKNENGIVERSIDFRTLALNYERTNSLIQLLDDDDEEEIILIAAQHLAFMTLQ